MTKSANQKLKLLYIKKFLLEKTDESHIITVAEIIEELHKVDIKAERKTIYADLDALRLYGLDIEKVTGKPTGYHVLNRTFQLPELKLLVDGVQSSRFITQKKSLDLIGKLEKFASIHDAQSLQRQVYICNRIKSMNESIYYNIDEIYKAIAQNKQISFKYFQYTINKELKVKKNGSSYIVSPWALTISNENYYLVAFEESSEKIKHYRVDKMKNIALLDENRLGQKYFTDFDIASYVKKIFSMYAGDEQVVKLRFANELVGVVIDRFGSDIMILKADEDSFTINVKVMLSPQFYGWLFGLGNSVQILSPDLLISEVQEQLNMLQKVYI